MSSGARNAVVVLGLVALSTVALPAGAQQPEPMVTVASFKFEPAAVTVAQGGSVTWTQGTSAAPHNVQFTEQPAGAESYEMPAQPQSTPWTARRTFTVPGTYRYVCRQHTSQMQGTVTVTGPPGSDTEPPKVTASSSSPGSTRSGARLTLEVSEAGALAGTLRQRPKGSRSYRAFGTYSRTVGSGRVVFRIKRSAEGKRVGKGLYKLRFTVTDAAGNASKVRSLSFTIR